MFISTINLDNWNKMGPLKLFRYLIDENKSIGPGHYVLVGMNEIFSQFADDEYCNI